MESAESPCGVYGESTKSLQRVHVESMESPQRVYRESMRSPLKVHETLFQQSPWSPWISASPFRLLVESMWSP